MANNFARISLLTFTVAACGDGSTTTPPGNNPPPTQMKAPVISVFTASKTMVAAGEQVELSWSVSNATKVVIVATPGGAVIDTDSQFTGNTRTREIAESTRFDLTATGPGGMTSQSVTITVDTSALGIIRFDANPNPGPLGGMSTVSWATNGANMLRVTDDMGNKLIETMQAVAVGSVDVTLDRASMTLTLEISNGAQQKTQTLLLTAQTAPVIDNFASTPGTFTGASAQVNLTWATQNATSMTLTANGNNVPELPSPPVATGTITVTVAETTVFRLTATSGAGSVTEELTVAKVAGETEPNDTAATASPVMTGGVSGNIADGGDVDFYSVMVTAGGNITAETSDGMGGCAFDTVITLYTLTGTIATPLGSDDDGGEGLCSRIDPANDGFATDLAAGTYYIEVRAYGMTGGDYTFVAVTGTAECGNGSVERTTNEQCDDGNTTSGDGCSDTCQYETSGTVMGPMAEQTFAGMLDTAGKVDIYVINMPQAGYFEAETFLPSADQCQQGAGDTIIELVGPMGTLGTDDDGGQGLCSKISPTSDMWAAVPAGTYFLRVRALSRTAVIANYEVRIKLFGEGCGNGVMEAMETCDDGNTTPGDGCNATCQFEGGSEQEPNNDAMTPTNASNGILMGAITPEDDEDWYRVSVPNGHHIDAFVSVGSFSTCAGTVMNLELYSADGMTRLTGNASAGPDGNCGRVYPRGSSAAMNLNGNYLLKVTHLFGNEVPGYFLHVDTIAPACGNELREPMEQGDEGNTWAGDGWDGCCQCEVSATIPAAGGTAMVALPAEDSRDMIAIDVSTAGSGITVTTDDGMGMCPVETTITLSSGTQRLGGGFSGGGACASIDHPDDGWAMNLAAGRYFLSVVNSGMATGTVNLVVGVTAPTCGNGVSETLAGERCDDGNTMPGDGCSATCQFEGSVLLEVEPNNDESKAQTLTPPAMGPAIAFGAIDPIGDSDWYQFDVPMGQTKAMLAETYGTIGNIMSCNGDTKIYLLDAMGMELANNDDGGDGLCSKIDGMGSMGPASMLTGGRYFLKVEHFNNTRTVSSYLLNVTLQ